jgi:cytochrome b subunit of formate dehydrogenase
MIRLFREYNTTKHYITLLIFLLVVSFTYLGITGFRQATNENDDCMGCHSDNTLTFDRAGKKVSGFVDTKILGKSIHAKTKCVQCHVDLATAEMPHEKPKKAYCGNCHKEEQSLYNECMHGKSSAKGDPLAPKCVTCHGTHNILPKKDKNSPIYPMNIPNLCGKCHKEGSKVQLLRNIPQTHILENYTESIHGEALLKKGLTVAATCASCHSPHRILPHTDPRSTINRNNIAATCINCHASIEEVHKKVIKGELWEKENKVLPACIDCHQPHKARKVFYDANVSDQSCKKCHDDKNLKGKDGKSMFVDHSDILNSKHNKLACVQCHVGVDVGHKRPCDNINQRVDCGSCHKEVGDEYKRSSHGKLYGLGDKDSPYCSDCHGTHKVLGKNNQKSPIFSMNVPNLCGKCHQEGQRAAVRYKGTEHNIINNYKESIHGMGLNKSGLTVTATCSDCHSPHKGLPASNPESTINHNNVKETCGKCHYGVAEQFDKSVHSPFVTKTDKKLPSCNDCHTSHSIKRTDKDNFQFDVMTTCGKCHDHITKTYFDTYHGKSSRLGSVKAAKCNDCHGSHDILPPTSPESHLSRKNIVGTCQKCHPSATEGFTNYLTHATHHDRHKYPFLFYAFWGMTMLLLGTFAISFLHTLLWLPRSFQMRKQMKALHAKHAGEKLYTRFTRYDRTLHIIMIISFLSLAITGMTLKFSYTEWSHQIAILFGGVENAGNVHRVAAAALFGIFIAHVIDLMRKKKNEFGTWKNLIFGPDSMVPNKKDLEDLKASIKWFLGKGERPQYGRWTYWEKFDYFAVFWGIFVIGFTGLTLWFPEFFTYFFPGSFLNVATIIHSDEALLASGFIFTIHFFNTHFRPEKFPMDTVIFSGQMTIEELKLERPHEYDQLMANGKLDQYLEDEYPPSKLKALKIFGATAVIIGLSVVVWIIYAMLFAY